MIQATQKKLREARFFLEKLSHEGRNAVRNEPEAQDFYLSAFLSAARSVTFAMQFEEKGKYDGWFPGWHARLIPEEQENLRFMNEQRVSAVKRDGADATASTEYVPFWQIHSERDGRHPAYGFHSFGPAGVEQPRVGLQKLSFDRVGDQGDVVAVCGRYLGILERLVREFIQAHSR